jgi:hypothetical protein
VRKQLNRLRLTWAATPVAVALVALAIGTGVHVACEAVEGGEATHATHRPAIVRVAEREPLDPGLPWVAEVVVRRSPMQLDCAPQPHEPDSPYGLTTVDFTQSTLTGGSATAVPGPGQYGGGPILPS